MHTQVLILGSGPAGCSAALYTALAGFQTTVLMGNTPGGQLVLTHAIDNFPGHQTISGFDLTEVFRNQMIHAGAELIYEQVERVDLMQRPFFAQTNVGVRLTADTLIIATGAEPKWLQVPGANQFMGHGISVCATCDGVFYKDKTVAVIGGGNSAAYEALFLAQTSAVVHLIYNAPSLQAEQNLLHKVRSNPKIKQLPQTQVLAFTGTDKLTGIQVKNLKNGSIRILPVNGVFEAIGRIPNSTLFRGQLAIDTEGYLVTDPRTKETSVPGVFACGDVQEPHFRQAVTAAGSGCLAALSAKRFLMNQIKN